MGGKKIGPKGRAVKMMFKAYDLKIERWNRIRMAMVL